jgi:cytochrome c553
MQGKFTFVLILGLALFLGVAYPSSALSSEVTGCVRCHTDEQILKRIYKPPKVDSSEGEG